MHDLGSILGVYAHPDDEAFLTGGLMARAARANNPVAVVTATKGEVGQTADESRWPRARLPEIREREIQRSLEILGLSDHTWMGYLDGACDQVPADEAVAKIVDVMKRVQPKTVFTFGPDGITGHPDHKAVCAWTRAAFEAAAPAGARLYFAVMTEGMWKQLEEHMGGFNMFPEGPPPLYKPEQADLYFELPPDLLDIKLRALLAHESQLSGVVEAVGESVFRDSQGVEAFVTALVKD